MTPRAVPRRAPPLTATYRLQLHEGFGFHDARHIVPYLARLGVSHLYLSPVLAARPGSTHGYDVADPRIANPELGGEAGFRALADAAHAHGLGVLVDIVPNHMGIGPANPFWMDVLRWGQASAHANVFDIDWTVPGREGVVVLPVLGDEFDAVLARHEIAIAWRGGEFRAAYFEHEWPIDPRTVHRIFAFEHARPLWDEGAAPDVEDARHAALALRAAAERSREIADHLAWLGEAFTAGDAGEYRLRALLDLQAWRPTHWRRTARDLNYRRFFDIGELAAVRVEDPAVFAATHAWTLDRVADRTIDGVRIDHVDGLRDPLGYLARLRDAIDARRPGEGLPLLVEKILSTGEQLRAAWPTDGTTGYEFANAVESIFVDPAGLRTIEHAYRRLLRIHGDVGYADVAARGKELVLRRAFDADLRRLVRQLGPASRAIAPRLASAMVHEAALQLAVALPVYRTYVRAAGDDDRLDAAPDDYRWIGAALDRARSGAADRFALQFVADVLRGEWPPEGAPVSQRARHAAREFALGFQQTSGPATAKGIEDTALYRWFPLASLNEVGGDPALPRDDALGALHAANARRLATWPRQLLAVETHDTKRSADVRARIDALSDVAAEWVALVARWRRRHAPLRHTAGRRSFPDANTEYLLYQTLVGLWPDDGAPDAAARAALCARVGAYVGKAAREAKAQTSWTDADAAYEAGLGAFVAALVERDEGATFRGELAGLVQRVACAAYWTGLTRVLVQTASPGTPDVYQGAELWSLALVDPDNRRPVDYAARMVALDAIGAGSEGGPPLAEWLDAAADGRAKLHVLATVLRLRREAGSALLAGTYEPIEAIGERAAHVVAFARAGSAGGVVAVGAVRSLAIHPDGAAPIGDAAWGDTRLILPGAAARRPYVDALSGRTHHARPDGTLRVADVLGTFPVACLRW